MSNKYCSKIRHSDEDLEDGVDISCDELAVVICLECDTQLCQTHRVFHESAEHSKYTPVTTIL